MSGESLTKSELMTLFEAARWAPSSINEQPWRFIYSLNNTFSFDIFLNLLFEGNRKWCAKAAALVVIISKKTFTKNNAENRTASFTSGAAMENLLLQASMIGLVGHALGGFDYDKTKIELDIPDDYEVNCIIAIGRQGKIEDLDETLRAREMPSNRKPLSDIICEGKFKL